MRVLGILLALISSAFAYSVLVPNANQGWTNQGVQPLEWQRAGTDRLNFSVFLVNQQISNFTPQLLGDVLDGTAQKTGCNPPQGGWPTGNGFQVNFVESDTAVSSILAQSDVFEIAKVPQVTVTSVNPTTSQVQATTTSTTSGAIQEKSHRLGLFVVNFVSSTCLYLAF